MTEKGHGRSTVVDSRSPDRRPWSLGQRAGLGRWRLALFVVGLVLSGWMVARSQVAGDQLSVLARGWILAHTGEVVPYGAKTSAGGKVPGSLTSLSAGLPLLAWEDHRASTVLVWASHLVAFLVLYRVLGGILAPDERLLFVLLFWFSPWRLYSSSFNWAPNYMFLLGALHTWTIFHLRRRRRVAWSFLHVLVIGLAFQIHGSFFLLSLASVLLLWRGYFRLHLGGAALGAAAVVLTLIPWLAAVSADPSLLPGGSGFPGRGLLLVVPGLRGVVYWLRYASLSLGSDALCWDLPAIPSVGAWLQSVERFFPRGLLYLTVFPSLWANIRFWRGARWPMHAAGRAATSDRVWLRGLTRWAFLAVALASFLSPTTIMSWQLFAFFHLAVLPLVFLGGALLRSRHAAVARVGTVAQASLSLLLAVSIGFASPMHRCGGGDCGVGHVRMPRLDRDHRMLDDLGIRSTCPVVVNDPEGWWVDVPLGESEATPGTDASLSPSDSED